MLALTKPRYFMPMHGEFRHLRAHAELGRQMGVPPKNIFIGDVGSIVLRERKHLAEDGVVIVSVALNGEDGSVSSGPEIESHGFVYAKEAEDLMDALRQATLAVYDRCREKRITDWVTIKSAVREELSQLLYKKTRCNPMIIPVIMEV